MRGQQMTFNAHFNGSDYDPSIDKERLKKQIGRVFEVMSGGVWMSLSEIGDKIQCRYNIVDPEASISAQLRHLKKQRFGSYNIERRRRYNDSGLWEYRLNGRQE